MDSITLQSPSGISQGSAVDYLPAWRLQHLSEPHSNSLLDLLKYRATKSIFEQYRDEEDRLGDHSSTLEIMKAKDIHLGDDYDGDYVGFINERAYGQPVDASTRRGEEFKKILEGGNVLITPTLTAELVLMRQKNLLQLLLVAVDKILEEGSSARIPYTPSAPVSSQPRRGQGIKPLSLAELVEYTNDRRDELDEDLKMVTREPLVLMSTVRLFYSSRPELVPDENGQQLQNGNLNQISGAFFDAVHRWSYLSRLLEYLSTLPRDKAARTPVLQELANVCNLEYQRAQASFRRHLQTSSGVECFKIIYKNNTANNSSELRTVLKGDPKALAPSDRHLQFMLRLCQPETNPVKAIVLVNILEGLHDGDPELRDKLAKGEYNAYVDLAYTIYFTQLVTRALGPPNVSRKKGQEFIAKLQELEDELQQLRKDLDLGTYVFPIINLLEDGVAEAVLEALDRYIVDKAGTKLGFLYQDIIEACLGSVQVECQRELDKIRSNSESNKEDKKEKTRPDQSSAFEIAPPRPDPVAAAQEELEISSLQTYKVSPSTAAVFSALFNRSQGRGSIAWTAFEAALAELGFSVVPKFGSVYTFYPPESMAVNKSFTVHRPHKAQIEGHLISIYAGRLKRLYRWGLGTFEAG